MKRINTQRACYEILQRPCVFFFFELFPENISTTNIDWKVQSKPIINKFRFEKILERTARFSKLPPSPFF